METEQQMVTTMETNEDLKGRDERKQRNKQKPASEPKDNSQNEEAPKEDYVHVRARRGRATNSHSLAERVRREKISERMKLLQDLVLGCDKVTGKALMLDEIINYVQSLQRQVEATFGLIRCAPSKKQVNKILREFNGVVKPSRLTLILEPPAPGKNTFLQALAGKLDTNLRIVGAHIVLASKFKFSS